MYCFSNPMGVGHTKIAFQLSDFAGPPSLILYDQSFMIIINIIFIKQ